MLTGRTPFTGASSTELVLKHLQIQPPPPTSVRPGLPAALDDFFTRALAKTPAVRFPNGAALAEALHHALNPAPQDTPATAKPAGATKTRSRLRSGVNMIGALSGRKLGDPEEEGLQGGLVTGLGGVGIIITTLQFVLGSLETVNKTVAMLQRNAPWLAITALVIAAVVAAREAWVARGHRTGRIALAVLGLVTLTWAGWAGWTLMQRTAPREGPLILIAQFAPCTDCPDKIYDRDVYNELLNRTGQISLPVAVKRVRAGEHALIESSQDARALGEQENAAIVLWGGYEPGKIIPHIELLGQRAGAADGLALDELRSFDYKLSDSAPPQHLADVALGMISHLRADDVGMLKWLERALASLPPDQQAVTAQPVHFYHAMANMRTGAPMQEVIGDLIKATTGSANVSAQHNLSIAWLLGCAPGGAPSYELALAASDTVIKSGRRDAPTFETRGAILMAMARYRDATAAYEESLALGGTDPQARADLARAYRLLGQTADAARIETLPAASLHGPATAADAAWSAGRFREAAAAYTTAGDASVSKDQRAQLYFYAGLAYANANDMAASAAALEASQAAAGLHLGMRSRFAASLDTLLGEIRLALGQPDKALAAFEQALTARPCDVQALLGSGQALLAQKSPDTALPFFERAAALDPADGAADAGMGAALAALHRAPQEVDAAYIRAERNYSAQARREPGNAKVAALVAQLRGYRLDEATEQLIRRANTLGLGGDFAAAVAPAQEAVTLAPDSALAHLTLGSTLHRSGQHEAGLTELRIAAGLDPARAGTFAEMGSAQMWLKRYEPALEAYRTAAALDPLTPDYSQQSANLLWTLGRPQEAIAPARVAVGLAPDNALTQGTLGFVLAASGNMTDALPVLARAVEISPSYGLALQQMAVAHFALGHTGDAVTLQAKVLALQPDDAIALVAYAYFLAEDGQGRAALDVGQRALALHVDQTGNPYLRYALGVGYKAAGKPAEAAKEFDAVLANGAADAGIKDKARLMKRG